MQTDYHHAITYVIARSAGFSKSDAEIIAHSSQYVDDATNEGVVEFTNGALYHRICSAHKMLDYRNFEQLANHRAWIPFHFLPGNGNLPAGQTPQGGFAEKLITRPNSPAAQDMLTYCINSKHKPYALHRLGITSHVFVDTWAHQGFAGISHKVNSATALNDESIASKDLTTKLKNFFGDLYDEYSGKILNNALPLGHGTTLSYPDRPYLVWRYKNYKNEIIERNNPEEYITASDHLFRFFKAWQAGTSMAQAEGMPEKLKKQLKSIFLDIKDDDERERHKKWLNLIAAGTFEFGAETVTYQAKGRGSWKHLALDVTGEVDEPNKKHVFKNTFLSSDWKLFHDALLAHRYEIIHEILPRYDICIA